MLNPIKKWFKKREVEKKFQKAGPGHQLANESASTSSNQKPTSFIQPRQNQAPSDVAKRAAAAAMARAEQTQPKAVNWSYTAIKAQAQKEIEMENQAAAEKLKQAPKEVFQESCPALTVSGVYFSCPLIGPEILSRSEIEAKIREFLYSQLPEERGLTSCLILHSCNKNREKVKLGIETLSRYIMNIIDNPTDEKYRKIRVNNKIFQERVAPLEGAFDYLKAAGFCEQTLLTDDKEELYYVMPNSVELDFENLEMLRDALLNAEPVHPVLDRNMKVLLPLEASEKINLPRDFFNLTAEELRREQEAKSQEVELMSQLRTKEMRERENIREMRRYRFTLIRVRFPDGIILQGTFNVHDRLSAVKEFISDNLAEPERPYTLLAPGSMKLVEDNITLIDLKLVPAVLLHLHWDNADVEETMYLKMETMSLLQNT